MKLFGLSITRTKSGRPVDNRGGWWPLVREPFTGAWQQNRELTMDDLSANHAVFACMTLVASDIAKLPLRLVQRDGDKIWTEVTNPAYSPVLRQPNAFQNRIQFIECWVLSRLRHGNFYGLKARDARGVVQNVYPLDPARVMPLVTDDGEVYYRLSTDHLARIGTDVTVPASEMIHDRLNCLYHPLVGISPMYAAALAARQGIHIQESSSKFFSRAAVPSGILIAPGAISQDTADRLKSHWEQNYSGAAGAGKVAVLGDGLKFEPMAMKATDAQTIEQLKWSAEMICGVFHVPPWKIGLGTLPSNQNVQAWNVEYYSRCLQAHIEAIEAALDDGLALMTGANPTGTEFDVSNLLRMDSVTQMQTIGEGVKAGVLAPNEGRRQLDLRPKPGGDSPYLQQQNFSLEALSRRDAQADPFNAPAVALPEPAPAAGNDNTEAQAAKALLAMMKGLA